MAISPGMIRLLRRELGNNFHVVWHPDHPLLLSGPDLLIGGEGKLLAALYVRETDSATSLQARITATRLALPTEAKVVGIMAGIPTEAQESLRWHFDALEFEDHWNRFLSTYARDQSPPKVDAVALRETKRRHSEKFAFALLLTSLRRKHDLETVRSDLVIQELNNRPAISSTVRRKMPTIREMATEVNGTFVTSLPPRDRKIERLRTLCNTGLADSYVLDSGVPYQRDDNLNVLLVEEWPTIRYDPEKPLRVAAFGCWIMARSSGSEDIYNLISRAQDPKRTRRWSNA